MIASHDKNGDIEYNASSPDELALVEAAKYMGHTFLGKNDSEVVTIAD